MSELLNPEREAKKIMRNAEMHIKMDEFCKAFNITDSKSFRKIGDGQFMVSIKTVDGATKLEMIVNHKGEIMQVVTKSVQQPSFTFRNAKRMGYEEGSFI